ncbi:hypothetical protein [Thalassobacillus pellis]|uniref:hypothetical protein n=1 Tax=Thalassobacillus pellis TaxID=748008 RepID=UPI00195FBED4|nr:hypothetical protein [Thalassobacillus pellis]MBM7553039.1 hypothetical protein [Thalassobacillus pellis]
MLTRYDKKSIDLWISIMSQYENLSTQQKVKKASRVLRLKYKRIGNGTHRVVYDLNNNYVLKVAITSRGLTCNKNEYNLYSKAPPGLSRHLCMVKSFGKGWIIMRKMVPGIPINKRNQKKILELKAKFLKHGIGARDLKSSNLAYAKGGELTVVDYGHFKRPRRTT